MQELLISSDPIGCGKERACYVHPDDPTKAVKVSCAETNIQSKREIGYYTKLLKRSKLQYTHIPAYYGKVKTNLGDAFIVDLVRDYTGEISRSLQWYIRHGESLATFGPGLEEVHRYLVKNLIIFNDDISASNVLVQKISSNKQRLVVIDGLGDSVLIKWLNIFPRLVRKKIDRRWLRFCNRLKIKFT